MKTEILIIGVILLGAVAVSGCTSNEVTDKSYNGTYMSFQYPDGFKILETNAGRTVAISGNGNILINQYSTIDNQEMFIKGLGVNGNLTEHNTPFNYTTFITQNEEEVMYFSKEGKYYVITYPSVLRGKVITIANTIKTNQ